eukprot:CAMPEP_0178954256 /NCGR_PEP_ID=MMETSP0789-20121207/8885_1 /TAXON_ID=3005 /ORGANISM="Rhizosolenia setigera, Strain CCMP 1694" /LENGTH=197 /DNA_ID=CAMNT_0020635629 /DNA_START=23 /DNA_END=613 /DNA_ORIENTATION=+
MASLNHTVPSLDISDVMNLFCTMKNQNDEAMKEILTKNDEILTKLNSIEEDNRKLRQELLEIKSSLKHKDNGNSISSRKRNQSEDKVEHENEHSNSNKKARVSVARLPDLPASFDTLDDDCLGNVLDFVGKKCYSAFGRVNKRCHEMFCSKGLKKETYLYGYGPLHLIQQQGTRKGGWFPGFSIGVLHYNRRDIFEW